ncbi:MAG TPA: hypothetical protein VKG23_02640, partial [Thermoanaerobaculia bacterium]|nr:hypothetical protein [Thermoanaerobaculia bacterium]
MAGTAARGSSSVRPVVVAAALVSGILLAVQLLLPPVIGLANNGDFERVLGPVGLRSTAVGRAEQYFSWIVLRYEDAPRGWYATGLKTSEVLLARAARLASRPFSPEGVFDLRWLGALHAALLVAGLALLVSATAPLPPAARWTAAALLVFVFTDVGYAAPLNSFYSQAASLVFLMLVLGVLARAIPDPGLSGWQVVLFAALAVLYVGSKPQEALQGFLLSAYAVRLGGRGRTARFWMRPTVWAAAAVCGVSVWYLGQTPPEIADVARY